MHLFFLYFFIKVGNNWYLKLVKLEINGLRLQINLRLSNQNENMNNYLYKILSPVHNEIFVYFKTHSKRFY